MDFVTEKIKDLSISDQLQVLNMINYRCKSNIEEIEVPYDEQLKVYQEQLLEPYH